MGDRGYCKTEESGSVSWKTMDKSIVVDGLAVLWEEVLGFCRVEGVFGWKRERCDCTKISSSEQMLSKWENRFVLIVAPKGVAHEHFAIDNQTQNLELECENGGERGWSEAPPVDGNGAMVETLAQDRSPLDREVQHECSDCHQGTSASVWGRSRGQNGLLRGLHEGLLMSVCLQWWRCRTTPKAVQNLQMRGIWYRRGIQSLWKRRWFRGMFPTVYMPHFAQDRGRWRLFENLGKHPTAV